MMFFINAASTLIPLHFLFVLSTICDFWLLKLSINFTLIVIYSKTAHRFVRTILSIPFCPMTFCPMTFCPYTILSIPFCPYRFVHYHFVRSPPRRGLPLLRSKHSLILHQIIFQ